MSSQIGYIYIATNPLYKSLLKIGATTNRPEDRVKQLSASTSSPHPFALAYSRRVAFPFEVEAEIHEALGAFRANDSREFFSVSLATAIRELEKYPEAKRQSAQMPRLSFAELFASFPDDGSPRELTESERAQCRALETK